jgi:hypothetical protein
LVTPVASTKRVPSLFDIVFTVAACLVKPDHQIR